MVTVQSITVRVTTLMKLRAAFAASLEFRPRIMLPVFFAMAVWFLARGR